MVVDSGWSPSHQGSDSIVQVSQMPGSLIGGNGIVKIDLFSIVVDDPMHF